MYNATKIETSEQHLYGCYLFPINLTNDLPGEGTNCPNFSPSIEASSCRMSYILYSCHLIHRPKHGQNDRKVLLRNCLAYSELRTRRFTTSRLCFVNKIISGKQTYRKIYPWFITDDLKNLIETYHNSYIARIELLTENKFSVFIQTCHRVHKVYRCKLSS
jgi:hypothetical protein